MNKKILKEQVKAKIQMTIAENIDTGKSVGILVEGQTVQINENFLRRIFSKGVKRFRLKFIEKGQNQIFFAANQQGIEWMSFTGGRLDEKGTFDSLDEAEEFIASKMKEGFKEVQNEAGIKEFMKKIKPALPKMIKIAAFGAIGVGVIILLSMALTPGAMSILATGGMSALVRTAGGTVADFAKDASGWIAGSFAVDAADAVSDLDLPDTEVSNMAPDIDDVPETPAFTDEVGDVDLTDDKGLSYEGHENLRQTSTEIFDKIQAGVATPEEIQTYNTLEREYGITPNSTFTPATDAPTAPSPEPIPDAAMTRVQGMADDIMSRVRAGTASPGDLENLQGLINNYGVVAR